MFLYFSVLQSSVIFTGSLPSFTYSDLMSCFLYYFYQNKFNLSRWKNGKLIERQADRSCLLNYQSHVIHYTFIQPQKQKQHPHHQRFNSNSLFYVNNVRVFIEIDVW